MQPIDPRGLNWETLPALANPHLFRNHYLVVGYETATQEQPSVVIYDGYDGEQAVRLRGEPDSSQKEFYKQNGYIIIDGKQIKFVELRTSRKMRPHDELMQHNLLPNSNTPRRDVA